MNYQAMSGGQALEQNRLAEETWELLIAVRSAVEDSLCKNRLNTIPTLIAISMVRAALRNDYEILNKMLGDIYREVQK